MEKTPTPKNNPETLRRECVVREGVHLREAPEGQESRTIEGYAILFNTPSAVLWSEDDGKIEAREIIAPEAVTRELLDASDIKFTLFHDRQLLLARSKEGQGTLSYDIDTRGVKFSFEAPHTADGDKAVELVRRGDLAGCSFAFSTYYWKSDYVDRNVKTEATGKQLITYTVRQIVGVYAMTLTATSEKSSRSTAPSPPPPPIPIRAYHCASSLSRRPHRPWTTPRSRSENDSSKRWHKY